MRMRCDNCGAHSIQAPVPVNDDNTVDGSRMDAIKQEFWPDWVTGPGPYEAYGGEYTWGQCHLCPDCVCATDLVISPLVPPPPT